VYVSGSVEFLSMIVGCARDAIVAETMHGTVAVWNAAAEELYGYPAAEMVGVDVSPRMSRRPADTLTVVGVELPAPQLPDRVSRWVSASCSSSLSEIRPSRSRKSMVARTVTGCAALKMTSAPPDAHGGSAAYA
jgi:PAS domain-containing protein